MQIRAGNLQFTWPPPGGVNRAAPATGAGLAGNGGNAVAGNAASGTKARPPELLRGPRKATEPAPTAGEAFPSIPVWRTPTREHLAEVIRDQGLKQ
jgi:hypothetical protein